MLFFLTLLACAAAATPPDPRYVQRAGDFMEGMLGMNDNRIRLVGDPKEPSDAANKVYVDGLCARDKRGIVPMLSRNGSNNGYEVHTSAGGTDPYALFDNNRRTWWSGALAGPNHVTIKTPHPVAVWKVLVSGSAQKWSLQGSNDGHNFTHLSLPRDRTMDAELREYRILSGRLPSYSHFRLSITRSAGAPLLKIFQIYSCDRLMRLENNTSIINATAR